MTERVVIVGSGAGGGIAAMVFAEAGYEVVVLERGPNLYAGLANRTPRSPLGADELSGPVRRFEYPDAHAQPRVFEHRVLKTRFQGEVNALPSAVGGGTVHWDAKTPRFWDIDFAKRSALGPVDGAGIVDWPFGYADLEPFYSEVESLIGVQGDAAALPGLTLKHAPRSAGFPMPAGRPQASSARVAAAAEALGYQPFPMQAAINSRRYDGRNACTDCGFCCEYGCETGARGGALTALNRAIRAGAELRSRCQVRRLLLAGDRVRAVSYVDDTGVDHELGADFVVLAASAVETCRLALRSQLPDPHGLMGTHLMFHACSVAYGVFPTEIVHPGGGRNISHAMDDFADPDFPGARSAAHADGLGYFRGGVVELGSAPTGPVGEAMLYARFLTATGQGPAFGPMLKRLMRKGYLRKRTLGVMMHAEDLAQAANRVTLDARVRDWAGEPVARIEYGVHRHERSAQAFYLPRMAQLLRRAGATAVVASPEWRQDADQALGGPVPTDFHTLGGMRMNAHADRGVVDEFGMIHGLANAAVLDGSVFPTSGAHNPTLTIMAVALRGARAIAGTASPTRIGSTP